MLSMPSFGPLLIALGCAAAGFLVGKYAERGQWNQLIEEGRLPRPRSAKH